MMISLLLKRKIDPMTDQLHSIDILELPLQRYIYIYIYRYVCIVYKWKTYQGMCRSEFGKL